MVGASKRKVFAKAQNRIGLRTHPYLRPCSWLTIGPLVPLHEVTASDPSSQVFTIANIGPLTPWMYKAR